MPYTCFTTKDARYGRNNDAVNNAIMEMVRERKRTGKSADDDPDVLDMLLSDELYAGNDLKVANDIRGLFLAGDETCNVTTANFLYYMTMHPEYHQRVIAEIMPTLEKASNDFVNLLSPDVVDEFVYTKQCVYETLRICPSGPCTMPSMFSQDVTIGGVDFKAH
jgi:cytochrome P450